MLPSVTPHMTPKSDHEGRREVLEALEMISDEHSPWRAELAPAPAALRSAEASVRFPAKDRQRDSKHRSTDWRLFYSSFAQAAASFRSPSWSSFSATGGPVPGLRSDTTPSPWPRY